MGMRRKSKATSWKHDGTRGKKNDKKSANKYQRIEARKEINEFK